MFFEESLIFFPSRYPEGDWNPPGLAFEDAWFESADGTHLHGWYCPTDRPRALLLFAHGNAGHLADRGPMVRFLVDCFHVTVTIFDYRGYGRSAGRPDEPGILTDARAARNWFAHRAGVEPTELVLLGRSLGGAVMVDLAAEFGARGLILESTFSTLPDVAKFHFPLLPAGLIRTRLDSIAKIGRYHGPLLQSHGDQDRVVPFELGLNLFEAANEPKIFVRVPGADHNDPPSDVYLGALDRFLAGLP